MYPESEHSSLRIRIEIETIKMITWPAILVHADDPELDYFASRALLEKHLKQRLIETGSNDYLVDSKGFVFSLSRENTGEVLLRKTGEKQSLDQVLGLVRAHASRAGYCCVAKLWAPTIVEAYAIVDALAED